MKAVRIHDFGGVEVLRYEDVAEPELQADQVLVRVRYCALNHLDLWVRRGLPGLGIRLPHILGSDIAGEVVKVGPLCRRIRAGQRVVISPGMSCRQCSQCLAGHDNHCPEYAILGAGPQGGYAEYIAVPEWAVVPVPADFDLKVASAAPLVFLTAYHMLFQRAQLKTGETVLVVGASSGVGQAAVQLARWYRCTVIATAGGAEKVEKAKALGADYVIDHTEEEIHRSVRDFTDGRGVDVVFEHVGQATWEQSLKSLARGGRLVTCGATTGPDAHLDIRHLFVKQQSILGSFMGTLSDLHTVLQLVFQGQVRPVIDSVFPLAEAAQAHLRMEERKHFGKILLEI